MVTARSPALFRIGMLTPANTPGFRRTASGLRILSHGIYLITLAVSEAVIAMA